MHPRPLGVGVCYVVSRIPDGDRDKFDAISNEYSRLYMAIGGILTAVILIEDPVKKEAPNTIEKLHSLGISKVVMLTGDCDNVAKRVADYVGADDYISEVLPQDKAEYIKKEHVQGRVCIMVGDGVNDSPALSEADVGIAINSGAAVAREVADITISEDDLYSLATLRQLSSLLMKRVNSNYRRIISFNSLLIILGSLGILQPTATALLHNSSTILIGVSSTKNLLNDI